MVAVALNVVPLIVKEPACAAPTAVVLAAKAREETLACVATAVTCIVTVEFAVSAAPPNDPPIERDVSLVPAVTADCVPAEPSRIFLVPYCVVLEIRVIELTMDASCDWFAASWSGVRVAELPLATARVRAFWSRVLTSSSAPSAVLA